MSPAEIRAGRMAAGFTQDQLAYRLGVSGQTIRNWEAGRRHPRSTQLAPLRRILSPECWCACHQPGQTRAGIPNWSADEDAQLRRLVLAGASPDEVVEALERDHDYRRSRRAILHRAEKHGLSFFHPEAQYSASDVASRLGVTRWRVGRWIDRGLLPAQRHIGVLRGGETRWWRILPADLAVFVTQSAGVEFDPAQVRDRALRSQAEIAAVVNRRAAS